MLALGVSYFLTRGPLQVSDSIGNLVKIQHASLFEIAASEFGGGPYLRPFLWVALKVVDMSANGHYRLAYKTVHALQVVATLLLAVRLFRVRSARDFAAAPAALAVIVGTHTFLGLVLEGYPINTFLTIVVCCLVALNLSESEGGWWIDAAACLTLIWAMFTVESGLLVWVCLVAAWLAGSRGVSSRGVAIATLCFMGYFLLRFGLLEGGSPGLDERSTGFGFRALDPEELRIRFGANPAWFYAYNVLSSVATVLFAEPRSGVWRFTEALIVSENGASPWMVLNVITSSMTTMLVLGYSVARVRRWARFQVHPSERTTIVFWGVILANAIISYPYTKDQIMSPAGIFFGLAAFAALRATLDIEVRLPRVARPVTAMLLAGLVAGWCVRAVGVGYNIHWAAWRHRNDWFAIDEWIRSENLDAADREFVHRIERQALETSVPHPRSWRRYGGLEVYFDDY